ncbi:TonB-linked outer membrane protein, SusC/RagA family [Mucilaginibacter pineti]|uniref:TonB-linked outer membrane protein, SusC/RagA family n=1 Tax=Mucilaginibacter pineti TaxID=1391627 RepID=A0A1G7H2U2_9SPHI|nr:SusC/RagA family TonB-linked outer membrane protein [Mucilaginibacter pineti]SDE94661.1 TonB-linked outer membrane protein, SusC/RagA family [Mucilaginibacter pineti]
MNRYILLSILIGFSSVAFGQINIRGKVISENGNQPLAGATIKLKNTHITVITDGNGDFNFTIKLTSDTILVNYVGYMVQQLTISSNKTTYYTVRLKENMAALSEVVVNTGYYQIPKERATGSFTQINNQLLNRSVTTNILDRLEGITNSLNFDRRLITGENTVKRSPDIRIRGVSTIESNEKALIVVDNFPYEGDISTINPNDVESITILKDAAAASIWGARAGNGVIVITTKQGRYNQKSRISFTSNVTSINRPDLFYNQNWLPSPTVMSIEKELFTRGNYLERNQTALPLYVELLIKKRNGAISDADFTAQEDVMKNTDVRNDALKYLYRQGLNQQYALNASGGGAAYKYYFSTGYDNNKENVTENSNSRLSLRLLNSFQPLKNLEFTADIWYTRQQQQTNGLNYSGLTTAGVGIISPYARLADDNGNALAIPRDYRFTYQQQAAANGLVDWLYRPLDELKLADNTARNNEIKLNGGLKYTFFKDFNINASYQFIQNNATGVSYYSPQTYYVRNLVNRFTQTDGTKIFPNGGVLTGATPVTTQAQAGRLQLNYNHDFTNQHQLSALAGAEVRQQVAETLPGYMLLNYNKDVLTSNTAFDYYTAYPTRPTGAATLPSINGYQLHRILTDRYLSYFANAADTYKERYTLSGSVRWDGSNIFGVNTNQKGVPLWSIGSSWELSKEPFYQLKWLPYLRLRATYGSSGNVNTSVSAFPTALYNTDAITGLPNASLTSAGNPDLRWEQVKTFNAGIDFALSNRRIEGSIEFYNKNASDLIGIDNMDPTTGIILGVTPALQNKINYANMNTRGVDIQLNSRNLTGKFRWETSVLFSYVRNKVTKYNAALANTITAYTATPGPAVAGSSRDMIYAFPWNGLDHNTGKPIIYINGVVSTDYQTYYNSFKTSDLVQAGVTSPPYFGSVRNTFSYQNFQVSANIIWKAGYVFRRSSMYPGYEYYSSSNYNMDYFKRWKNPGDELITSVPAAIPPGTTVGNNYMALVYKNSEALITKGDHIRLQDVNLSYRFQGKILKNMNLSQLQVYAYARNLGILWRANKNNLDPDYANASYPEPQTFALGLKVDF